MLKATRFIDYEQNAAARAPLLRLRTPTLLPRPLVSDRALVCEWKKEKKDKLALRSHRVR